MHWSADRYWQPAVGERSYDRKPPVDALIAVDRQPYRVLDVRDVEPVDWEDEVRDLWVADRMPDPWWRAPFTVILQPLPSGRRRHVRVNPRVWTSWWQPLPEHYAVCVVCGELAPCREITAAAVAEHEMERFAKLAAVLPGCCWSCSEPITARQESVTFDGDNLLLPTAPPSPAFHMRRQCRGGAARYEELWVAADPRRPRSLLTLKCAGTLVRHADGSAECFGAVDSDCPDERAAHAVYTACYIQSHGCPRECPREGHPGAHARRRR